MRTAGTDVGVSFLSFLCQIPGCVIHTSLASLWSFSCGNVDTHRHTQTHPRTHTLTHSHDLKHAGFVLTCPQLLTVLSVVSKIFVQREINGAEVMKVERGESESVNNRIEIIDLVKCLNISSFYESFNDRPLPHVTLCNVSFR